MRDPERAPNPASLAFAEELLAAWQAHPAAVSPDGRAYFECSPGARSEAVRRGPSFPAYSIFNPPELTRPGTNGNGKSHATLTPCEVAAKQDKVDQLVRAFRTRGPRPSSGRGTHHLTAATRQSRRSRG